MVLEREMDLLLALYLFKNFYLDPLKINGLLGFRTVFFDVVFAQTVEAFSVIDIFFIFLITSIPGISAEVSSVISSPAAASALTPAVSPHSVSVIPSVKTSTSLSLPTKS